MVISDRLSAMKQGWRQEWQGIMAEVRNVKNVTGDIKTAATNIEATATKVKNIGEED
jgi:hypothetical protein